MPIIAGVPWKWVSNKNGVVENGDFFIVFGSLVFGTLTDKAEIIIFQPI